MSASFTRTLRRMAGLDEGKGRRPRARVLAVAAQKGGVGKTTTAVNLAAAAARFAGLKTLLVDLDGQGHVAAALSSGYGDGDGERVSLSDVLLGDGRDLMEIVRPTRSANLFVTPSDKGLAATEGILAGRIGKEFLLRDAMRGAVERFDLVVLDCPPNIGNLTLNALAAAHACLLPCDMSVLSLAGVADMVRVLDTIRERLGHPVELLGILPTKVDMRNRKVTAAVLDELKRNYGTSLCKTRIPVNTAIARAQMAGVPVFDFDARARGAAAYRDLMEEVTAALWSRPEGG